MRIVFPDPLIWESGIEFGLQAVGELVKRGLPVEFSLLDQGAMLEAASFCVSQYQLQSRVRWVRRWPRSWTHVDVAVFPRVAAMPAGTIMSVLDQGIEVVSSDPDLQVAHRKFHQFHRRDCQSLTGILQQVSAPASRSP